MHSFILFFICLCFYSACGLNARDKPDPVEPTQVVFKSDVCKVLDQLPRQVYPSPTSPCDVQVLYIDRNAPGGGLGTRDSPASTLLRARQLTLRHPRIQYWVLLGRGPYAGPLIAMDGINVVGGFYGDWRHEPTMNTVIEGVSARDGAPTFGAVFNDIAQPLTWMNLNIRAADATWGGSSYGIWARRASGITLRSVNVSAGQGGSGVPGDKGQRGQDGKDGAAGAKGASFPGMSTIYGQPGSSPWRLCHDEIIPSRAGQGGRGATSMRLAGYGVDTDGAQTTPPGWDGQSVLTNPEVASSGFPGEPQVRLTMQGLWRMDNMAYGEDGADGRHGQHGFGGGGGMIKTGHDHIGPGGASGGNGGCGGQGGQGGGPGGGSFGLFLIESSHWTFHGRVSLNASVAGQGAKGAQGGLGGVGGQGGAPQSDWCHARMTAPCDTSPYRAGAGGDGANGQQGGHGGGGAAGWSIALYCVHSTPPGGDYHAFTPAASSGGASGPDGAPGARGLSQRTYGCH